MNRKLISLALLAAATLGASAAKPVKAPAGGTKISNELIGIFFEDISMSADGGLCAELIQNGSFEFSPSERDGWGAGTAWRTVRPGHSLGYIEPRQQDPIHPNNPNYMRLNIERVGMYYDYNGWTGVGIQNDGYDGILLKAGDTLFFKQQMVVSGGFLTWIGTYFTQFFYHPWLGVTLLCAWWALLMWLTKKAFNIPTRWIVVVLIPVALLLLTNIDLGYWIFYLKLRGHFFVATIGSTIAIALVWLYRSLPKRFRLAFIILSTALFYPLIGFYALMAALLMGIMAWRLEDYKVSRRLLESVVAALAILAIPLFYYRFVYYQTNIVNMYR